MGIRCNSKDLLWLLLMFIVSMPLHAQELAHEKARVRFFLDVDFSADYTFRRHL